MSAIENKPNILFLSCFAGGGHEAGRKAIEESLGSDYSCHALYPVQMLSISRLIDGENLYNRTLKLGMRRLANLATRYVVPYLTGWGSEQRMTSELKQTIEKMRPILVISLIPIFNKWFIQTCAEQRVPYCLITLDPDLTHWVLGLEKVAHLISPMFFTIGSDSPKTRELLEAKGIDPARIRTIGFPLRKEFFLAKPSKGQLCQELGIPCRFPIVLLMSGGNGEADAYSWTKELTAQPSRTHFIVIAGNNESLLDKVRKIVPHPRNLLTTLGYTERVSDYMRLARLLVTKPGPGTVSEAREIYRQYQTPFVLLNGDNPLFWEKPNIETAQVDGFGEPFFTVQELARKVSSCLARKNPPLALKKNRFHEKFHKMLAHLSTSC